MRRARHVAAVVTSAASSPRWKRARRGIEVLRYGEEGGIRRMWQGAPWTTWALHPERTEPAQGPSFRRRARAKQWVESAVARARREGWLPVYPSANAVAWLHLADVMTVAERRRELGLPWPRTPILEGADADRLVDELEHVASPE